MAWSKSPPALVATFESVFPEGAEQRQMFGYPAGFVGGNMFMGLWQQHLVLRLGDKERAKFLALDGAAQFEPMPGRPMKEYVIAPPSMVARASSLRPWVAKALAHAAALPAKKKATAAKKGTARKAAPKKG